MTREEAIEILCIALEEANKRHPEWYYDIIHCAAVMNEEAGEAIRAALNYTYEDGSLDDFIYEVAQTGAVAIKMLMNLSKDNLPKKFKQFKEREYTKEERERIKIKSLEWLHNLDSDDQNELEKTKEEIDNTKSCVDGLGHVYYDDFLMAHLKK
jgi:hypothetical protein